MSTMRVNGIMFAFLVLMGLFAFWKFALFIHDDALISLRYAKNFVAHGELVWNLGERIEGYTNLLHILFSSSLMRVGLDPISAARLVNFAGFVMLIAATFRSARYLGLGALSIFAGLALLVSVPIIAWIWGGLEGPLSAGFLALAYLFTLKSLEERRVGTALIASAVLPPPIFVVRICWW